MDVSGHNVEAVKPVAPIRDSLPLRSVDSTELLQGSRELLIRHGTSVYKLRVTASEKLILTK